MPRCEFRRAPAGFARCDERSAIVADCEIRDGGMKEGCRIVLGEFCAAMKRSSASACRPAA